MARMMRRRKHKDKEKGDDVFISSSSSPLPSSPLSSPPPFPLLLYLILVIVSSYLSTTLSTSLYCRPRRTFEALGDVILVIQYAYKDSTITVPFILVYKQHIQLLLSAFVGRYICDDLYTSSISPVLLWVLLQVLLFRGPVNKLMKRINIKLAGPVELVRFNFRSQVHMNNWLSDKKSRV